MKKFQLLALAVLAVLLIGCRQSEDETPERLPRAHLSSVPLSYADVVEHVSPAVVNVRSSKRISVPAQYPFSGGNLFEQFLDGGLFGQAGDIIAEINHQPIRSEADVGQALAKASGRPSLLLVNRGGQSFFVTVNVG
jgi:S1-C subfamily serine protease